MADHTLGNEPITNIVLVGSIGHGKSATGNSLLGRTIFTKNWGGGGTTRCEMHRAAIQDGPIINVIDTPGLVNGYDSTDHLNRELIKCLTMAEEGIHAVLFVISATRWLAHEEEDFTLDTLQRIFGSKILDYFIVVFTGGDELEEKNYTLDDYMGGRSNDFLMGTLRLCRGRKVLFNNRTNDKDKKAAQLQQLLAHVADIQKQNGGVPYTEKIKELDDKLIKQEMEAKILAEKAAMDVHERFLNNLKMEHERTVNKMMMAHIVESALKESAASHKREIDQLKDILKLEDIGTMNMMENALQNDTDAKDRLKYRLHQRNRESMLMMEKMVVNGFKVSEATHEKEMDQLKKTLQLNDSQTKNMMEQMSAAAHEREKHYQNMQPQYLPGMRHIECNIM